MSADKDRRGRPTNNPKNVRVTIRLDEESVNVLSEYCEQERVDRAEAIRRGIKSLKQSSKK